MNAKFFVAVSIASLCALDAHATTTRARPGSIAGAAMRAGAGTQPRAQIPVPVAAPAPAAVTPAAPVMVARTTSPATGNPLAETTRPDGRRIFTDMANGEMWIYDTFGELVRYAPNPDDVEIPILGVTVGIARRACLGIHANGHQAVFDEDTHECFIPVVAHNWGGVIRAGGRPVVAWARMGDAVRCHASAFDQISAMRRTSQWVVPVMIVGGAGIGYGVGYIIDRNQERRVDDVKKQIGEVSGTGALRITFQGRQYDLSSTEERRALVAAMQSGNTSLQAALDAARQNVNDCAAKLFQELVSPSAEGAAKFGDVRISSRGCECGASDENLIHCSGHPANPASVASRRPCPAGRTAGGFRRDGTCYFRTGFGPVATAADRTASFDLHRANLINDFMASHQNIARRMDLRVDSGPNNRLNSLSVCMTSGTFGDLSDALSTTPQNCPRTLFAANSPAESLGEWMRAAEALRLAGEDLAQTGSPLLDELLAEIDGTLDLLLTTEATITGRNVEELLDLEFGKNRPWLQTARGRGTLIGGGIGALAGIGYYFAEGKSVFCNVGGMGQPRLNGTFSIPTFRQYIISRNYMNLDEMNPPE